MFQNRSSGAINYFAYGSNLHPVRIGKRVNTFSLIGTVKLSSYRLKFNKRGQDGSAKCNMEYTGHSQDFVLGAIYEIDIVGLQILDQIEGLNAGYRHEVLHLTVNGSDLKVLTYVAMPEYVEDGLRPFEWYKQLVLEGMLYHFFDGKYVAKVEEIVEMPDLNRERNAAMIAILSEIRSRVDD